jgi:predicted flap endonuclease-1-like 5' DNA nuclease
VTPSGPAHPASWVAWPVLAVAHWGLFTGTQPLATWFYPLAWWSYVALLDGVLARRGKPHLFAWPPRRLVALGFASWAFWLLFEAINLRIANWYYVGVPEMWLSRWLGVSLSFATVLPLLQVTERALAPTRVLDRLIGPCAVRPLRVTPLLLALVQGTGLAFLVLPLAFPRHAFPLVWGFVPLLLDPANHRRGLPSLLGDWERGSARRFVTLLLAGLVCGLLWEGWNFWAVGKWIYTVPFLNELKLFEMPPLGFLGFPPLAVAGWVFGVWLNDHWRRAATPLRGLAVGLTFVLGLAVLAAMDRYTVDAPAPRLDGVALLDAGQRDRLEAAGVGSIQALAEASDGRLDAVAGAAGLDPVRLRAARDWARLARLKGIGNAHAARLGDLGIRSVADLARQTPKGLYRMLDGAEPLARLRVWVRAARRAVLESGGAPSPPG